MVGALGGGGFVYQASRPAEAQAQAQPAKPQNELERLQRENELLKLNLEVVLKEVQSLKAEVAALKGKSKDVGTSAAKNQLAEELMKRGQLDLAKAVERNRIVEDALRALKEAPDDKEKVRRALEAMDNAMKSLRESTKAPSSSGSR